MTEAGFAPVECGPCFRFKGAEHRLFLERYRNLQGGIRQSSEMGLRVLMERQPCMVWRELGGLTLHGWSC